jgi:hydrogenase maturation protein HypF
MPLQHHYAHIASCMAENELTGPVTGFAWDGTGYGTDGSVWGGECIDVNEGAFRRVGTIRSFSLPGGEAAVREPRRCAAGILYELYGGDGLHTSKPVDDAFTDRDRSILSGMLAKGINAPVSTSMGRLFDAVSAFCGVRMKNSFEGQAAMELEYLASKSDASDVYPIAIGETRGLLTWNWGPMVESVLAEFHEGRSAVDIAGTFHRTLANVILRMAQARKNPKVVLSGGCFQNMKLLDETIAVLRNNGFTPYWHQRIPANDGGISLGQLYSVYLATHHHHS